MHYRRKIRCSRGLQLLAYFKSANLPYSRDANLLRKKKVFLRMKTVFWLEKQHFSVCFHRSVHKVILEKKSILRHFAQNPKYLQLEKSTKYCKKGTVGISATPFPIPFSLLFKMHHEYSSYLPHLICLIWLNFFFSMNQTLTILEKQVSPDILRSCQNESEVWADTNTTHVRQGGGGGGDSSSSFNLKHSRKLGSYLGQGWE